MITVLLTELQRLTGLVHAYVSELHDDGSRGEVRWAGANGRGRLDRDPAADGDLQTCATLPVVGPSGQLIGELCGASTAPVELGSAAEEVMRLFSRIIAVQIAEHR